VHCPACGRALQVFPASPLPLFRPPVKTGTEAMPPPRGSSPFRFWLLPGLAAAVTLVLVLGMTLLMLRRSEPAPSTAGSNDGQAREHLAACLASARASASEGAYHSASDQLTEAIRLCELFPQLSPTSIGQLRGELRQTKLLADLSGESLPEIARHAVGLSVAEWKSAFMERYAGKAVVFDVRVYPNAGGVPKIDYVASVAGAPLEWDAGSLELWQSLPLRQPTRCLFGARLASVTNVGGRWLVHFRPASGVLLTDPDLLGGLSIAVDEELRAVLRRQSEWAADLPAGRE
jgi:hypothetical protein